MRFPFQVRCRPPEVAPEPDISIPHHKNIMSSREGIQSCGATMLFVPVESYDSCHAFAKSWEFPVPKRARTGRERENFVPLTPRLVGRPERTFIGLPLYSPRSVDKSNCVASGDLELRRGQVEVAGEA